MIQVPERIKKDTDFSGGGGGGRYSNDSKRVNTNSSEGKKDTDSSGKMGITLIPVTEKGNHKLS